MATELVENEFGTSAMTTRSVNNGMVAVAQQREIAEVQSKMILARMNPRDEIKARDRILCACTRPKMAETSLYSYSRGGSEISGPSIRLAEVIAQNWGNFDFGVRELEQRDGESTVEAYAWDLETNVSQRKIFQMPHIRHTKKGRIVLTDPRDIYEMIANQGARRVRACILGVIPGDIIEEAVAQCEKTLRSEIQITPELLQSLIDKFSAFAVTKEMIEKRIQRRIESIPPAMVVQLGKIYNSLKDGMSKPHEWFGESKPEVEKASIDINDLTPSAEPNRGHGDENLNAVKKPKTKPSKPLDNPDFAEGSDPEPVDMEVA